VFFEDQAMSGNGLDSCHPAVFSQRCRQSPPSAFS